MLDAGNIKTKNPTWTLDTKFYGPLPVPQVGTQTCTLDIGDRSNIFPVFHVSILGPYRKSVGADQQQNRPPPKDIKVEIEY